MTHSTHNEGISTTILHSGYTPHGTDGAIIPPLHLSSTFLSGNSEGYEYSRSGNPTRRVLERTLAALDEAHYALAYSSGSAVLANIATLLKDDEEFLFSSDAYGGTYRYIATTFEKQSRTYHIGNLTDLKATEELLKNSKIKIVWVESPTNPLLKVSDIRALAALAHTYGALLVIDNTFATPVIQKPLLLGADIVVYSTTKYINGHSDSIGGSLAVNDKKLYEELVFLQNAIGSILSPFDSWLTLRGLRTLELRMERHVKNAQAIAGLLQGHDKVKRVYYPQFFNGGQGEIVARQMRSPGAIISIELDERYDVQTFLGSLVYFPLAESLGGIDSLIDHPATMTHASIPAEERKKIGLSDNLLRISVGIENQDDLLRDIAQALDSTQPVREG